jgi:hypothetical protein
MCDGEADDVDCICELYAAEAHRSAPLRTTISVNLREQLRGAGTARRLFEDSAPCRAPIRQAEAVGLSSEPPFPALPSFLVWLEPSRIAWWATRVF